MVGAEGPFCPGGAQHRLAASGPDRRRERIPPAPLLGHDEEPRQDERPNPVDRLHRARFGQSLELRVGLAGIRTIPERLRRRSLPVICRVGRPTRPPAGIRGLGWVPVGAGQPGERPRPGHDPVHVVAAAAGRQPTAAAWRWATRSTSRAASPIAVVVTSRCASGSQAWLSAPCWLTMRSGPKDAARAGTRARTPASQVPSPVPASSGRLTEVPAATPSPSSSTKPVPGKRVRPLSWIETVSTPGSSRWIAWTPSPWWTSRSTYITRRPARRAAAIARAGSL